MKAHLIDTHLLVPRSRSSAKVKVRDQGHVSQKMGISGALVFHKHILFFQSLFLKGPRQGGSLVSVSDSRPGGCEFDPQLRRLFFLAYFRLSPLQKHVRKVVGGFGKKSCVSTGVRKPGNTYTRH